MKMKKCRVCFEVKPVEQFYKREAMRDGYKNECMDCTKQYRRNLYTKSKKQPCETKELLISNIVKLEIFLRDKLICQSCRSRVHVEDTYDELRAYVYLKIPFYFGGTLAKANLQTLCRTCFCGIDKRIESTFL